MVPPNIASLPALIDPLPDHGAGVDPPVALLATAAEPAGRHCHKA
jgi:hypothetical protein